MSEYYYVVDGNRNGPVAEDDLRGLAAAGSVTGETLVWTEGMADWQPYSAVLGGASVPAGGGGLSVAAPPMTTTVTCNVCHQQYPPDQVVRYGANVVCGNCKPEFLQRLREGAFPSGVLDYASFGRRFLAKILDLILMWALSFGVIMLFAVSVQGQQEPNPVFFGVVMVMVYLVPLIYPILFLGKWGQTLGKMAMKIKVVTPAGEKIGYGRATGRVFSEIVTGFTFGIGYLMVLWDAERRTLHDMMAGTRVLDLNS